MREDFDHTKAYEDGEPMGEAINHLMELAEEHDCPVVVVAISENKNGTAQIQVRRHSSDERPFTPNIKAGIEVIHSNPVVVDLVGSILAISNLAERNVAKSIIEELKND